MLEKPWGIVFTVRRTKENELNSKQTIYNKKDTGSSLISEAFPISIPLQVNNYSSAKVDIYLSREGVFFERL
jgi:hypothetical protein